MPPDIIRNPVHKSSKNRLVCADFQRPFKGAAGVGSQEREKTGFEIFSVEQARFKARV